MSNPTGPERPDTPADDQTPPDAETEVLPEPDPEHEPATEVISPQPPPGLGQPEEPGERRYTAPSGFDAGSTQIINRPNEPATEVFASQKSAGPQVIPPRGEAPKPAKQKRHWGWVAAIVVIIAVLAVVAIVGTILLTRGGVAGVSQEEQVRTTIQNFDTAVQNGDLATLRSITCGSKRDTYVNYSDERWAEIHKRVAAAKQYPVVASIDQVVINGDHAEANVTTFMAYAPQTRSTRSFDLQFRDDQWKVCQTN
ncbi:DUF4878 domain-containing protein [Mycolicibacterium duvalii]|uniref:Uncharacterized protein n=1 Tax=Mycolicibacterium duvalii TaxID=39688 RepID=A0A7I7K4P5_9MYCO|nr:DUF4878 domain-containing protein [Mycolicibacterium duvalii]MCV7369077.1 DUF4878 domain-containing protein [Mycolicibacterium duvalii]PEG36198.1 DUF4878 domain-containing protein [Mycolicibacterium duvalii]BBX19023.1 hypothetical protein MDUV_38830 [Mycolicibacterium duvalii]